MPATDRRSWQNILGILAAGVVATAIITTLTVTTFTATTATITTSTVTTETVTGLNATNSTTTNAVVSSSFKLGSSGTALDGIYFATSTQDPSSIETGQATSNAVTITGAKVQDACFVSKDPVWAQTTGTASNLRVSCQVTASNTATLTFANTTATSINPVSGVASMFVVSGSNN